jgi:hypothetical protein
VRAKFTLLVALLALGALAGPATSSAAAPKPLTETQARSLALKLARQVGAKRDAEFWSLSTAVKKRRNRFEFAYTERTPDAFFCTARIVVTQSGFDRKARLSGTRCTAIPAEVLAIERATREALRSVEPKLADVRRSVTGYERAIEPCEELEPPPVVAGDAELFLDAGLELALYDPIASELERFATALEEIDARDSTLAAGIVSWRRWIGLLASAPAGARDACAELRAWDEHGYSDDQAPAGMTGLREWHAAYERQFRRMVRASERLLALGASERVALAFVPNDLATLPATR